MSAKRKRKFYRTVIQYEVLSEEPIGDVSLEAIDRECMEGSWSGMFLGRTQEIVDGPTMARLLTEQGSDPEFFQLDDEGREVEE